MITSDKTRRKKSTYLLIYVYLLHFTKLLAKMMTNCRYDLNLIKTQRSDAASGKLCLKMSTPHLHVFDVPLC